MRGEREGSLIRIPVAYAELGTGTGAGSCVFQPTPPGQPLCPVDHAGLELAFQTARLVYPHAAIQFIRCDEWSSKLHNDTSSHSPPVCSPAPHTLLLPARPWPS